MRLFNFWYFLCAILLYALAKMLFDNILYAAILLRLHSAFGIEERDVIAIVAANLIPILATIVALALIYGLARYHHAAKAKAAGTSIAFDPAPTTTSGKSRWRLSRFLNKLEPLPAITLGLAIAVAGSGVYQHYQNSKPPPSARTISAADKQTATAILKQFAYSVNIIKKSLDKSKEVLEGWQYRIQVNGADEFLATLGEIYDNMAILGFISMSNAMYNIDTKKFSDLVAFSKRDDPGCIDRTLALINEVKRIKEHKGADVVFTLINDTKLVDWRTGLPECEKWIAAKTDALAKLQAEYAD